MNKNSMGSGTAWAGYERVNHFTLEVRTLTPVATAIHDRIHELGVRFEENPPLLSDPEFKEWDVLRMTLGESGRAAHPRPSTPRRRLLQADATLRSCSSSRPLGVRFPPLPP